MFPITRFSLLPLLFSSLLAKSQIITLEWFALDKLIDKDCGLDGIENSYFIENKYSTYFIRGLQLEVRGLFKTIWKPLFRSLSKGLIETVNNLDIIHDELTRLHHFYIETLGAANLACENDPTSCPFDYVFNTINRQIRFILLCRFPMLTERDKLDVAEEYNKHTIRVLGNGAEVSAELLNLPIAIETFVSRGIPNTVIEEKMLNVEERTGKLVGRLIGPQLRIDDILSHVGIPQFGIDKVYYHQKPPEAVEELLKVTWGTFSVDDEEPRPIVSWVMDNSHKLASVAVACLCVGIAWHFYRRAQQAATQAAQEKKNIETLKQAVVTELNNNLAEYIERESDDSRSLSVTEVSETDSDRRTITIDFPKGDYVCDNNGDSFPVKPFREKLYLALNNVRGKLDGLFQDVKLSKGDASTATTPLILQFGAPKEQCSKEKITKALSHCGAPFKKVIRDAGLKHKIQVLQKDIETLKAPQEDMWKLSQYSNAPSETNLRQALAHIRELIMISGTNGSAGELVKAIDEILTSKITKYETLLMFYAQVVTALGLLLTDEGINAGNASIPEYILSGLRPLTHLFMSIRNKSSKSKSSSKGSNSISKFMAQLSYNLDTVYRTNPFCRRPLAVSYDTLKSKAENARSECLKHVDKITRELASIDDKNPVQAHNIAERLKEKLSTLQSALLVTWRGNVEQAIETGFLKFGQACLSNIEAVCKPGSIKQIKATVAKYRQEMQRSRKALPPQRLFAVASTQGLSSAALASRGMDPDKVSTDTDDLDSKTENWKPVIIRVIRKARLAAVREELKGNFSLVSTRSGFTDTTLVAGLREVANKQADNVQKWWGKCLSVVNTQLAANENTPFPAVYQNMLRFVLLLLDMPKSMLLPKQKEEVELFAYHLRYLLVHYPHRVIDNKKEEIFRDSAKRLCATMVCSIAKHLSPDCLTAFSSFASLQVLGLSESECRIDAVVKHSSMVDEMSSLARKAILGEHRTQEKCFREYMTYRVKKALEFVALLRKLAKKSDDAEFTVSDIPTVMKAASETDKLSLQYYLFVLGSMDKHTFNFIARTGESLESRYGRSSEAYQFWVKFKQICSRAQLVGDFRARDKIVHQGLKDDELERVLNECCENNVPTCREDTVEKLHNAIKETLFIDSIAPSTSVPQQLEMSLKRIENERSNFKVSSLLVICEGYQELFSKSTTVWNDSRISDYLALVNAYRLWGEYQISSSDKKLSILERINTLNSEESSFLRKQAPVLCSRLDTILEANKASSTVACRR